MANGQVRVVGSGFTTFNWKGVPLAWCERVADSGQSAFADASPVQGILTLTDRYPREIVTSRVLNFGTMTLTLRELWNSPVWQQLAGLEGTSNIVDVYERLANEPSEVTCQLIIQGPGGVFRGKTYHNVIITNIDDSENVSVGTLSVAKTIAVAYTHTTPITG